MVKKVAKIKKVKPPKIRNSGTLTESAFWSFIRSTLRRASRYWKPIQECKKASRRAYKGSNNRQKFEYECSKCHNWFPEKQISVDHIEPVGRLNSAQDLPIFVENLFCEINNLRVLCDPCHDAKTIIDKENIKLNKQIKSNEN